LCRQPSCIAPVLLKNSNLFYFNDLCKLPESLLRFDITAIFGRKQLENALQAPREPIYITSTTIAGSLTVGPTVSAVADTGTDLEWWQNNSKLGVVGQEIYGAGGPIWYALWQN